MKIFTKKNYHRHMATLNKRKEIFGACRHRNMETHSTVWRFLIYLFIYFLHLLFILFKVNYFMLFFTNFPFFVFNVKAMLSIFVVTEDSISHGTFCLTASTRWRLGALDNISHGVLTFRTEVMSPPNRKINNFLMLRHFVTRIFWN